MDVTVRQRYVRRQLSRLQKPGLSARQERRFRIASIVVVLFFAAGWTYAIALSVEKNQPAGVLGRVTANPLDADGPPEAAFLFDAALSGFAATLDRGQSGAVNVIVQESGDPLPGRESLPEGVEAVLAPSDIAMPGNPDVDPGVWNVLLRAGGASALVPNLNIVRLVPMSAKRGGSIGAYRIGDWPNKGGIYAPPSGLIEVTPQNRHVRVSEHFTLGDFLTKGQENVWPKYVAMSPRLLDKLELTIQELEASGYPVEHVGVISGFRTPYYNAHGGSTAGRGELSRHMYGDAMDIYIDNDRDGRMDDLDGNGRVDVSDAKVLASAADRVEKKYPTLIGGIGTYRPTGAHAGFVHVDTRGFRARW
ncbi:MAG TPA: DUF882 domain-containing protein [Vicinamibacterales bacterium]|nr:DUF882 domain-containing protein [Vicinamibacterales bacterium]